MMMMMMMMRNGEPTPGEVHSSGDRADEGGASSSSSSSSTSSSSSLASSGGGGLKKNFRVDRQLRSFYSGGKVAWVPHRGDADASEKGGHDTDDGDASHKRSGSTRMALACTHHGTISLIDPATAQLLLSLPTGEESVTSFAVHPGGRWVVTCGHALLMRQWDLHTGLCTKSWKAPHKAPITVMAFSLDGAWLATGSADRTVSVWDFEHGFYTHKFKGHQGVLTCVEFRPNPSLLELYTGAEDGQIRVWNLETRGCRVMENHLSAVTALAFYDDGYGLVSVGRDKVMNVWNLKTYAISRTIPVFESIEAVCPVTPSKTEISASKEIIVAVGGEKGVLSLWDIKSGRVKLSKADELPTNGQTITALMRCPVTGEVVSVTSEHNIVFHEPESLRQVKQLIGYNDEIIDVKYLHKGTHIVVATNSAQLRVFDLSTLGGRLISGHTDLVLAVDVSPDSRYIASASKDNTVRIWETKDYKCVATLSGHMEAVHAVAWAQNSSNFLISGSKDKTIKFWDTKFLSGQSIAQHKTIDSALYTKKAHDKVINSLAVAPNDKMFATASQDKTIKLWNTTTGEPITTFNGHRRGVWHIEFSPVERCLLSASADKTIKLWDVGQMICLKTLEGHTNSVLRASFLTHGMQVISSGSDGTLKLWTIKTSECINTFTAHEDRAWSLAVRDEGSEVISAGGDSVISVWHDCTAADEAAKVEAEQQKILKEQELSNCLRKKNYTKALQLAFALDQPAKVLHICQELCRIEPTTLGPLIRSFSADRLVIFLKYIRDWNTKLRFRSVAQQLLNVVLRSYPPTVLCDLPDIKTVLEGLIPFTDRHLEYVNRQLQTSYIIDYTIQSLNLLSEQLESASHDSAEEGPGGPPTSTRLPSIKRKQREEKKADKSSQGTEEKGNVGNHTSSKDPDEDTRVVKRIRYKKKRDRMED